MPARRSRCRGPAASCSPAACRCGPTRGWPITRWAGQCSSPGPAWSSWHVRAGDEVGCPVLEELVVEAPLAGPGARRGAGAGGRGRPGPRTVRARSTDSHRADDGPDAALTRHATGHAWRLRPSGGPLAGSGHDLAAGPPSRCELVDWLRRRSRRGAGTTTGRLSRGCAKSGPRRRGGLRRGTAAGHRDRPVRHPPGAAGRRAARGLSASWVRWPGAGSSSPMLPFACNGVLLHASGARAAGPADVSRARHGVG